MYTNRYRTNSKLLHSFIALAVLGTYAGCASTMNRLLAGDTDEADGSDEHRARYWGPECAGPGINVKQRDLGRPMTGKQPKIDGPVAHQVHRIICVDEVGGATNEPERNSYVQLHIRFDDLDFDHYVASQIVLQCAKSDTCAIPYRSSYFRVEHRYQVAMVHWYADQLEVEQVKSFLQEQPISAAAQSAYLTELDRAIALVKEIVEGMPEPEKALFVEIPRAVHAERAAYRERYAAQFDQLQQLRSRTRNGSPGSELVLELEKLRADYVKRCGAIDCTKDPLFVRATELLVVAHVMFGNAVAARAEVDALGEATGAYAAELIAAKQRVALQEARRGGAQAAKLQAAGVAADGAAGYDFGRGGYLWPFDRAKLVAYADLVPREGSPIIVVVGTVHKVTRKGRLAEVSFKEVVKRGTVPTDCHDTSKIDRIENGRVYYRRECRSKKQVVNRKQTEPVLVPVLDARALRAGDILRVRVRQEGREGYVHRVERAEHLLQVRSVRAD